MTRKFDPIQYYDMGGSGYGDMKEVEDGDYVRVEDHEESTNELKKEILTFLEKVLTGGWKYVENGDMFTDATELKNKLKS